MQHRKSEMKRVVQPRRLVSSALFRSGGVRGGALSAALATLLSLGFATFATAAGAPTRAGAPRPPVSIRPPLITGNAQVGQILRADPGKWRGHNWRASKFSFQWRLCGSAGLTCTDVAQANDRIYTVRVGDVARTLRVVVTAANAAGTASAPSRQTALVGAAAPNAPAATARPLILGKALAGAVLTAQVGTWTGSAPIRTAYHWRRCNEKGGACNELRQTGEQYTLRAADVGHAFRVLVTAQNSVGTSAALSLPTASVIPSPSAATVPRNTQRPTIAGTAQQGQTLRATTGSWTGSAPITFSFQWLRCASGGGRCGQVAGAAQQSYTVRGSEVSHTLRVRVTARNAAGASAVVSAPTRVIVGLPASPAPPKNTAQPTISGTAQRGQTLRATTGSWTGSAPITFSFQWLRCASGGGRCGQVAGAMQQSYTVRGSEVSHTLRVRVAARNAAGASAVVSAPTRVIVGLPASPAPPKNTGQPTISGSTVEGKTLTTSNGSWSGTAPFTYQYRWLRCDQSGGGVNGVTCATIAGETRTTYVLANADVGHRIRSRVIAANKYGTASFNSNATGVVQAAVTASKPNSTAAPTISGSPVVDQTLRAGAGSWTGGQPIALAYQWRRCDRNGGSCSSISGATTSTYTLKTVDVGTTLRVQVTATNRNGSSSTTSVPTAVITRAISSSAAMAINDVALPNRLIIDRVQFRPITLRSHRRVIARFRVVDSNNRAVQGALVKVIGIPFGQVSTPPEQATGPTGYATFALYPMRRYHGTGIVFFVRARKPGERLIGGVSTRRLVFLRG